MSVTIVTYANLGKKRNQPTADIVPVINEFAKAGELRQVICQIYKDFYFRDTISATPAVIRYPIRLFEKVLRVPFPRRYTEFLFDFFAERSMRHADITLFHGGFFLPRTFRKSQAKGSITVDITRTAHLQKNAEIEREEIKRLGLKDAEVERRLRLRTCDHCNDFDYVIAISRFVKDSYVESGYPADRIFLASPDVDLQRFSPRADVPNDGKFRVLYMAYTTPTKGLHYLLDAWDSLSLTNAELVLIGGYGELPADLKRQYDARIAANETITWKGNSLSPEEEYHQASVFVFPSLTEGFGRVTLEAMASGIPVITTENARGIVEDGKTGFVVPIRDAAALKEKIAYLYHNQDVVRQMGKDARNAAENKKPFGEAVYEICQEVKKREDTL